VKLIAYLNGVITCNAGYVAVQLAKEDLARVKKLRELAQTSDDLKSMQKAGLYIGWTKGDFRTHELKEPLNALMKAIHEYEHGQTGDPQNEIIMDIWTAFHTLRLKTLVHCL
jgi:hypothetical protein